MNLGYLSLLQISDMLRQRALSCAELTEHMLQRIARSNPDLNCFLHIFDDTARRRALDLDRELQTGCWRGPLHGVPVAVKDIFDFPGYRASGGTRLTRSDSSDHATVMQKLDDAGTVLLGTLNLDELAAGGSGDNPHFGRCKNPWDPARSCGGSSGGSAVAVAAGLAFATIGSDAGGSIRIPAAFCGVVGLKPSYGRVSRFGALARTWSMDCIGPLARSSADACVVFNAILGHDPQDATSVDSPLVHCEIASGTTADLPRIGCIHDIPGTCTGANHAQAASMFESAGYALQPTTIEELERYTQLQQILVKSEGAAMHQQALSSGDQRLSFAARSVIEGGLEIPAVRYIEALSLRAGLLQSFIDTVLTQYDLLLMPVSLPCAPLFSLPDTLRADEIDQAFSSTATMTRFANYLGLPAISIPTGCDESGMPNAIQLIGRPFEESLLLSTAAHFESLRAPLAYPGIESPN